MGGSGDLWTDRLANIYPTPVTIDIPGAGRADGLALNPPERCPEPDCSWVPVEMSELVAEVGLTGDTTLVYFCQEGHGPFGKDAFGGWTPLPDEIVRDRRVADRPDSN